MAKLLPVALGQVVIYAAHGKTLRVTRLRHDFFAGLDNYELGRFGNAEEIRQDISYFLEMGCLPKSTAQSWA